MKTWEKPVVVSDQASLEVTRYLPAELGNCESSKATASK